MYRQAAQAYCCAGYGVGEPLHDTEPDEIHAGADEKDHSDHRCNCGGSEYARHDYYAEPTALGGGIHQRRNQDLARPENKNHEQRPWRDAYPAAVIMNVGVLLVVAMLVRVT